MGSTKTRVFKKLGPPSVFLILSAFLIFSWFKQGLVYGGGDVGLQTFNSSRYLQNARYIWWEATAPGFPDPQGLTAVPLQFFFSILEKIGFSPWMLQATLFFTILFSMGYGMYLFVISVLGKERKLYAAVAAIFYLLNPYMMIQVWHRFIPNTMVLAAVLPFLVYLWLLWIKKGNLKSLFVFLLLNLLSVYFYGSLAFIVTVWLLFFLLTISKGCFPWAGFKNLSILGGYFAIGFILWVLTNSWWLVPTFSVGPGLFFQQHNIEESIITLISLGRQTIMPFFLQFINPFYLFQQLDLGKIYMTFPFRLMPWFISLVIFIGLIKGFYSKSIASWSVIFLIISFLSKGVASPFGYLYILGFTHFFPLGIIRNPFEKIGILLPFLSSILFAFGIQWLFNFFKKYAGFRGSILITSILILATVVFSFPMFTGQVLGTPTNPGLVKPPRSIKEADDWIKSQKKDGQILHLPLSWKEDVKYLWEYGYSGLDPNSLLFTSLPSISHGFNLKAVDNQLTLISLMFSKPFIQYKDQTLKLLQDFNVHFIVLHKDTDWLNANLYDHLETEQILSHLDFLEKKAEFGNLVVYQVKDEFYQPNIILSDNNVFIYPSEGDFSIWPRLLNPVSQFVTPIDSKLEKFSTDVYNQSLIFPKSSFIYGQQSASTDSSFRDVDSQITGLSSLNTRLLQLKTYFDQNGMILSKDLAGKLISSSEVLSAPKLNLDNYRKTIIETLKEETDYDRFQSLGSESILSSHFRLHLSILKDLEKRVGMEEKGEIYNLELLIKQKLENINILPKYGEDSIEERQVFRYKVPYSSSYKILMPNPSIKNLYDGLNKINFLINGVRVSVIGEAYGDFMSFGKMDLSSAPLEISLPLMLSKNLIPTIGQLNVIGLKSVKGDTLEIKPATQGQTYVELPLSDIRGEDSLRLSVEAKITQGNGYYILVYENSAAYIKQGVEPPNSIEEFIPLNPDDNWHKIIINVRLKPATQTAMIVIALPSSGNMFFSPALSIRDVKIQRVLTEPIILSADSNSKMEPTASTIGKIERKSPVEYTGELSIDKPTFLFFKESYHPGWELTLTKDNKTYIDDKHFLGNFYGNAWYIDKTGEFKFKIQFKPNQSVDKGIVILSLVLLSLFAFLLVKGLLIRSRKAIK